MSNRVWGNFILYWQRSKLGGFLMLLPLTLKFYRCCCCCFKVVIFVDVVVVVVVAHLDKSKCVWRPAPHHTKTHLSIRRLEAENGWRPIPTRQSEFFISGRIFATRDSNKIRDTKSRVLSNVRSCKRRQSSHFFSSLSFGFREVKCARGTCFRVFM